MRDKLGPCSPIARQAGGVMKTFAYVRASAPKHDLTLIGFEHIFIAVEDESAAYSVGHRWGKIKSLGDGVVFLNDYAFEVTTT